MHYEKEILEIKKDIQSIKDEMKSFLDRDFQLEISPRDFAKQVLSLHKPNCDSGEEVEPKAALKEREPSAKECSHFL